MEEDLSVHVQVVYLSRPGLICECKDCKAYIGNGKVVIELTQGSRCFILEKPHAVRCCDTMRRIPFTFKHIRGASRYAKRLRYRLRTNHLMFSNLAVIPGSLDTTHHFQS